MDPTVVIVGRPNVGKSTLFNRLIGRRLALTDNEPGVTRDWREGQASLGDLRFRVIDTAGLEDAVGEGLAARMRRQTEQALTDAAVIVFLFDARAGVTPLDEHFADWLRRVHQTVVPVANKCEGRAGDDAIYEAYRMGLGAPVPISAEHGDGLSLLYEALAPHIDAAQSAAPAPAQERAAGPLRLAVVGRPNVGKSTLVNALLGHERVLTGPEPGITRDAIAVAWMYDGRAVELVDTAGLRRRAKIDAKLEKLSVADSLRAVRFADVVALVLDATVMLERQDLIIANQVSEEGRAIVIVANKWDAIADRRAALAALHDRLATSLPQLKGVHIVTLSALTERNLDRFMPTVLQAYDVWNRRIATGPLNEWLRGMVEHHSPPLGKSGRPIRLRYATQPKARPPTFAIFANRPADLPDSYVRYLENSLRVVFDLPGTPIRIALRKGRNPYTDTG